MNVNANVNGISKFLVLNAWSICNKYDIVMEHVLDFDADVLFLSETWLKSQKNSVTAFFKDYGYLMYHNIRKDRTKDVGGGVGFLVKESIKVKNVKVTQFVTFEHCIIRIYTDSKWLSLISIYRLSYEQDDLFFDEFRELLEIIVASNEKFIIAGDINIHMDNVDHSNTIDFTDILSAFNLAQLVNVPTHRDGHILDIVVTGINDMSIVDLNVKDLSLSDHFLLSFCVPYEMKKTHYKKVTYRNIKDVNREAFSNEIRDSLNDLQLNGNFGDAITKYNNSMMSIMDRHAPKRTKKVKIAENASWFDNEYKELRKKRRKAEKTFLQHPSPENRETFKTIRKETTTLALRKKQDYYTDRINQAGNKQKELFKVVNKLRDLKQDSVLPSSTSDADLANEFVDYFKEKISKIRESFTCDPNTYPEFRRNAEVPTMNVFKPATEDELRSIVKSYGVSCSPEDPIQIYLMKDNIDLLLPCWLRLVNLSLSTGSIDRLKSAVLIPLLKELDSFVNIDLHKNYRPVSNLPFIEKLIERCVATRLNEHMQTNSLESSNEYGYKKGHSTELLLTKVTNDFLLSFDKKFVNVLLLLDLSAAFDTVDQDKLLKILHDDIGITGTAHQWFVSFLKGHTQKVMIKWNIFKTC